MGFRHPAAKTKLHSRCLIPRRARQSRFRSPVFPIEMPRAVVLPGPNHPLEIREYPRPTLEPGEALLQTLYSEVCGTDVHLHHGKLDVPFPIIPGHVSVGIVAEARGNLTDV